MTDPILRALAGRIIPLLIITIAIISIPTLATISGPFSYQAYSLNATSTAISAGTLSVLWGDSYAPARINQGTGNETLTITGAVTPRADLPGYYTYDYPSTTGELEAEWNTSTETYVMDIYFYQGYSSYNKTTIVPSQNIFAAMYFYFKGDLTVNGVVSEVHGLAALVAAAPGFFSFKGTARATYVVLYPQTYHGNQYVFRWSQTEQIISGLEQPASEMVSQTVELA